jgi:TolB protein
MRMLKTAVLLSALMGLPVQAQIQIEISKSADNAIPFAVVPFSGSNDIANIIASDLNRSGRFKTITQTPEQINLISQINPQNWQSTNVTYAAVGSQNGPQINFELGSVSNKQKLEGRNLVANNPAQVRRAAHQIADIIFEKLTGLPGAFDSRVAYITTSGRNYALVVADGDGAGARVVLNSNEPIFSPSWSPDSAKIAYSTLEGKRSRLVIQDLQTGNRRIISEEAGINSAPSWSPDGSRLVFTLSKDGNPEIYTASAAGGGLTV